MLHGGFERTKRINTYKPIPTSRYPVGSVGGEGVGLDNELCYVTGVAKEEQEQGGRKGEEGAR